MNRKPPKQTTAEKKKSRGLKSSEYLAFLSQFPSRFSLSWGHLIENPIELHHEACSTNFTGDKKSWNDYQAIPLTREEHAKRHASNIEIFWGEKNPRRIVSSLLKNFAKTKELILPSELKFFPSGNDEETEKRYIQNLSEWVHSQQ